MTAACVVLAAGASRRFGSEKLLHAIGGQMLLERALRACAAFPTIAVCSSTVALYAIAEHVTIVVNDSPDLGMSYSLQLANALIDPNDTIAVLPADLAHIEPPHVAAIVAASDGFDVAYPARTDRTPGHPVVFSPRARSYIAELEPGDTIRELRDRDGLTRRIVLVDDAWPYEDIDVPADLSRPSATLRPRSERRSG
jgi:molybdenum cofactor cytidylyltransferase